jgi:hypothetical protein
VGLGGATWQILYCTGGSTTWLVSIIRFVHRVVGVLVMCKGDLDVWRFGFKFFLFLVQIRKKRTEKSYENEKLFIEHKRHVGLMRSILTPMD